MVPRSKNIYKIELKQITKVMPILYSIIKCEKIFCNFKCLSNGNKEIRQLNKDDKLISGMLHVEIANYSYILTSGYYSTVQLFIFVFLILESHQI